MSFIRKRQRTILLAGVSGFFVALILLSVTYFIFIRGNATAIDWILEDSQLEVNTMLNATETEVQEVVAMTDVYTLVDETLIETVIEEQMIMKLSIEERFVPANAILDKQDIIGKKAAIDIQAVMILTESMLLESGTDYVVSQTAELQNIHVPDLLQVGDDVNLRIHFPSGQDYVVLEDKQVLRIHEEYNGLYLDLWEDELLAYSSALVDCQIYPGTYLYLTRQQLLIGDAVNVKPLTAYPVNPNVWTLATKGIQEDSGNESHTGVEVDWGENGECLLDRMFLDISLAEYYDDDYTKYRYVYEELANQAIDFNQILNQLNWGSIQGIGELDIEAVDGLQEGTGAVEGIREQRESESEAEPKDDKESTDDSAQDDETSVGF